MLLSKKVYKGDHDVSLNHFRPLNACIKWLLGQRNLVSHLWIEAELNVNFSSNYSAKTIDQGLYQTSISLNHLIIQALLKSI